MAQPDTSEIRRVLQVYDQSSQLTPRQAVSMLQGITKLLAKAPEAYDLLTDPADAEAWRSAGGESYCDNQDFPDQLAARWLEVLGRPDFANAGFDKDELTDLKGRMHGWIRAFQKVELGFGNADELLAKLDELLEAAPDAVDSDEDEDSEQEN